MTRTYLKGSEVKANLNDLRVKTVKRSVGAGWLRYSLEVDVGGFQTDSEEDVFVSWCKAM